MEHGEETGGKGLLYVCFSLCHHHIYICPTFVVFSLGCGIGYGYLHRIPTRPIQPKSLNENIMQMSVTGNNQESVSHDHTEVPACKKKLGVKNVVGVF